MPRNLIHLVALPVLVQFWELFFGYYTNQVAKTLGDVVGNSMKDAQGAMYSKHLNYLLVRVQIDPQLPLVQNIKLRLDNGRIHTMECKYERVLCSCSSFYPIGHTIQQYPRTPLQILTGLQCH